MKKLSRKLTKKRIFICSVLTLVSLFLLGAVKTKLNTIEYDKIQKAECEKLLVIVREISIDIPPEYKKIWLANAEKDPYFYLLANTSYLKNLE